MLSRHKKQLQELLRLYPQSELLKELKLPNEPVEGKIRERMAHLEEVIKEQEAFTYAVSHELRAPLRHINSYGSVLLEDFRDRIPCEAVEFVNRICEASVRMSALIENLLELSRIDRGPVKPQNVNMSEMAGSILRALQEAEPQRRVESLIAENLHVFGEAFLLNQLLTNLLGNAWKYTSKTEPAYIEFGRTLTSGKYAFYVKDNGVGFDILYKEKIFEAFSRLHGEDFPGMGIGLATACRIVKYHGGKIWAEGSVGKGATFFFSLPESP